MHSLFYSEGEGTLGCGPDGFYVVVGEPDQMVHKLSTESITEMAEAANESPEKLIGSLKNVLEWAHGINCRVFFEKNVIKAVRIEEVLLDAVVTRVEPYVSELQSGKGRVMKVVQRLFDGNTPKLDTRYIIGIPWNRRDLKRHWASSVHTKVKVRKTVLSTGYATTSSSSTAAIAATTDMIPSSAYEKSTTGIPMSSKGDLNGESDDRSDELSAELMEKFLVSQSTSQGCYDSKSWSARSCGSEESDSLLSDCDDLICLTKKCPKSSRRSVQPGMPSMLSTNERQETTPPAKISLTSAREGDSCQQ